MTARPTPTRTRRSRRARVALAGVACVTTLAAGCTSQSSGGGAASRTPSSSSAAPSTSAPSSAPRTTAAAAPRTSPLTGGKYVAGPVIAVKIDDTEHGRPQRNIDQADIVYIEQAEGGLTRLVAVFDTHKPVVGYVRSVRTSDPELLAQYGHITLAASGGGGDSLPTLDRAPITGWIMDRGASYYGRAPHDGDNGYVNVTLDLAGVSSKVKYGAAKSIGFTWQTRPAGISSRPQANDIRTVVGSTPVEFRYDPATSRYVRYIDGVRQVAADGNPVSTPNVVLQYCDVSVHPGDVDVNGNPAQYTHSVGRGTAVVFRNGKVIKGTWTRLAGSAGTLLRDSAGKQIPLNPGGAWVVLATTGAPLTTG